MKEIVLFGAGGHAKCVIDSIEAEGKYKILGIIDDNESKKGEKYLDYEVLGGIEFLSAMKIPSGVVTIGDNYIRKVIVEKIQAQIPNFNFINVVDPRARVIRSAIMGVGNVITANAGLSADAQLGDHCIILYNAILGHDCFLGSFSSIMSGAVVGGGSEIGSLTSISLNATVVNNYNVGNNVIIGAGSVVTSNIPDNVVAYGVPARIIRERKPGDKYLLTKRNPNIS